ncbi:fluoride efflux transporter FluC [Frondihabitans australicus]|uniref:Fluoride-specific ion channel FluC n=1 Tax=Frondihabitans australicus TaxID=386892 RepID=A0A495IDQ9_9MICO|nr:CrcB family protein [Frondihabitans australicus]RKR73461.1 camphor resistance protein CrcB [Frondihabitans australicus]
MNPALAFALVCLAGGVGAALRFVVDGAVRSRWSLAFPLGTVLINVSGSFVLGALTGAALHGALSHALLLVLGGGLMGGYTTFSTASLETYRLAAECRIGPALANGAGTLVVAAFAAALGLALGAAL